MMKPTVIIEYCPRCGWMLRAAYMAQELLTTFTDELHGVLLQLAAINGRYIIYEKYLTAKWRAVFLK